MDLFNPAQFTKINLSALNSSFWIGRKPDNPQDAFKFISVFKLLESSPFSKAVLMCALEKRGKDGICSLR